MTHLVRGAAFRSCNRLLFGPSIRHFARKKREKPSLEDLFDNAAESIFEIEAKKTSGPHGLGARQAQAQLAQRTPSRILIYPEERDKLREKSVPVTEFNDALKSTVNTMLTTMYEENGIGISAPQIGVLQRVIAINETGRKDKTKERVFVNPKILKVSKKCDIMEEGCLSFPDTLVEVIRRCRIDLEYTDLDGNVTEERFTDISARIIQHELDHLEGVLLVDKMNDRNRL